MASKIAGLESITLLAFEAERYYETIEFYASLGFIETKSFAKGQESSISTSSFSHDSEREAWLINFDEESDETVVLKVRLCKKADDGPISRSSLTFKTRSMQVVTGC
jgi:hypothetical protein